MTYFKYIKMFIKSIVIFFSLIVTQTSYSQEKERPFILVKNSDRTEILNKIKTKTWAKEIYENLKTRTDL